MFRLEIADIWSMPPAQDKSLVANRYQIERPLGSGAFGTVYLCRDTKLANLAVALKLFHPTTLNQSLTKARIHRELRACFRVQHDNTVFFYDTVRDDEQFGYTMEYIDGEALTFLCRPKLRPSIKQTQEILKQITLGLRAIHNCGIVHRDLKPANILLSRSGAIKVTDYGLARPLASNCSASSEFSAACTHDIKTAESTMTTVLVGSPAYICPTYLKTKQLTQRSDLYALGVIAFELLTSKRPFQEESIEKLLLSKLNLRAANVCLIDAAIPQSIGLVVAKLLEPDARDRFSSCDELLDAIAECAQADSQNKRRSAILAPPKRKPIKDIRVDSRALEQSWSLGDAIEWLRMRFIPACRGTSTTCGNTILSRFAFNEIAVLGTMLLIAFLGLGYLRGYLIDSPSQSSEPIKYEMNGVRFFGPARPVIEPIVVRKPDREQ